MELTENSDEVWENLNPPSDLFPPRPDSGQWRVLDLNVCCRRASSYLTGSAADAERMAGLYDAIPFAAVALFAAGVIGVMIYEKSRPRDVRKKEPGAGKG